MIEHAVQQLTGDTCTSGRLFGRPTPHLCLLVQLSTVCSTLRGAAEAASKALLASAQLDMFKLPPLYLSPLLASLCRGVGHLDSDHATLASTQAAAFPAAAGTRSLHVDVHDTVPDLRGLFASLCSCPQLMTCS